MKKLVVLLTFIMCIMFGNVLTVSAAETEENQTINIQSDQSRLNTKNQWNRTTKNTSLTVRDGYTVYGYIEGATSSDNNGNTIEWKDLAIVFVENSTKKINSSIKKENILDYNTTDILYTDGKENSKKTETYATLTSTSSVAINNIYYHSSTPSVIVSACNYNGFRVFKDRLSLNNYLQTGNEDGIIKEPSLDDTLYISGLNSYLNSENLNGSILNVQWIPSIQKDYPSSDLKVECKISFTMEHKRNHEKITVNDYPVYSDASAVFDSGGKFSFYIYDIMEEYCKKNNIDDTFLIMNVNSVYCRYVSQSTKNFGRWQEANSSNVNPGTEETEKTLDFVNFKPKVNNSTIPYSYTATWDVLEAYDNNTYLTVNADISWLYTPNQTNSVTYVPVVELGKYKANTGSYAIPVDEVWKQYFEKNGINSSLFETKWTTRLYFQIVKYDEKTQSYIKSSIKYFEPHSPTTGNNGADEKGDGTFNPDTGQFEKDEDTVENTDSNTGETIKPPDIFDDLELPEDSSVASYFSALFKALIKGIEGIFSSIGQIPAFIGALFSFLPDSIIALIGIGFIVVILLRIVGR